MEPAYTPLPLQSASFSRIPFLSSPLLSPSAPLCISLRLPLPVLVSTVCFFFGIRLRGQVFPHADAKSTELLEIIAVVDTDVLQACQTGQRGSLQSQKTLIFPDLSGVSIGFIRILLILSQPANDTREESFRDVLVTDVPVLGCEFHREFKI